MTRYFLDSSALVKHYHTELGTDAVDRIIGEAGAELLIARLTLVETISVFAIKVRTGEFDVLEFARLRALFATHIARRRYQVFRLLNVHYVRARELINFFAADTPAFRRGEERRPPNVEISKHTRLNRRWLVQSGHRLKTLPSRGAPVSKQPSGHAVRRSETQPSREAGLGPAVRRPQNWPWTWSPPARET